MELILLFDNLTSYYKNHNIPNLYIDKDYYITLNDNNIVNEEQTRDILISNNILNEMIQKKSQYILIKIVFIRNDKDEKFKEALNYILFNINTKILERFNPYHNLFKDLSINGMIIDRLEYNNLFNVNKIYDYTNIHNYDSLKISNLYYNYIFFKILYHIDYRLLNLNTSINEILVLLESEAKLETIKNYEYKLTEFTRIDTNEISQNNDIINKKNGVLYCHGNTHSMKNVNTLLKSLNLNIYANWTTVDKVYTTLPDVTGDFKLLNTVFILGVFKYDYVITMYCPIYRSYLDIRIIIRNSRLLLREQGKLIIPKLIKSLVSILYGILIPSSKLNIKEYPNVKNELNKIIELEYYTSYDINGIDIIFNV